MRLKTLLFVMFLSGCASLPPAPEIEQDGYSWRFRKFRACDTVTHACRDIPLDDPDMEGAQCLSAEDYKKSADWVSSVEQIAKERCR